MGVLSISSTKSKTIRTSLTFHLVNTNFHSPNSLLKIVTCRSIFPHQCNHPERSFKISRAIVQLHSKIRQIFKLNQTEKSETKVLRKSTAMSEIMRSCLFVVFMAIVQLVSLTFAERQVNYITGTDINGNIRQLRLDRSPALYTGDFGDCKEGGSLLNVTKFDAGIYTDNFTVVFHLDGVTGIESENLMVHISLWAYGEERFTMVFNPCDANIHSLCPLNASVPVTAYGRWYLTPQQIEGIPEIAYGIPDFDGYTRVQIFGNSTQSLIGCFQADMTNGNSFSHPKAVGSVLGVFSAATAAASFLTSAYGVSITHMRSHYAHTLSGLLVFETFQTVFFSGALTIPWPKVLPAWWSNFAWSVGIIPTEFLLKSINVFTGVAGNAIQVSGETSLLLNSDSSAFQQIYSRLLRPMTQGQAMDLLTRRREPFNESNPYDYTWAGKPIHPGVSLPGTWIGFSGTLSTVGTPSEDAFLLSLVWLLIFLLLVSSLIVFFKYSLEILRQLKAISDNHFKYFRGHWMQYLIIAVLRILFVSFIAAITLCMYQFSLHRSPGPTAIAVIFCLFFMVGFGGLVVYACFFRLRHGRFIIENKNLLILGGKVWKFPFFIISLMDQKETNQLQVIGSASFPRLRYQDDDPMRAAIHQDSVFVKRFGWLSGRYRRTRWWFFAYWVPYQFIRACFIGGSREKPAVQLFGLLTLEIISFATTVKLNPFEGCRNVVLGVWMLGIVKVLTPALSIAFLPTIGLNAIISTGFGIIIVVAQGLLIIAVMVLAVISCVSTWISLCRNSENFPDRLEGVRIKYYEHIEARANDFPRPRQKKKTRESQMELSKPLEARFSVRDVRKAPKIEDEYFDPIRESWPSSSCFLGEDSRICSVNSRYSVASFPHVTNSRMTSWSSRDFSPFWDTKSEKLDGILSHSTRSNSARNSLSTGPLLEAEYLPPFHRIYDDNRMRIRSLHFGRLTGALSTPSPELLAKYSEERFSHIPGP